MIGKSRAKEIIVNLLEIAHLLVGGSSNGGKSTFLRQLIVTLYLRNPKYTFHLVDLKEGLEFQVFEGLPRVEVITSLNQTIQLMCEMEACLKSRMELLRLNKCKDIKAYLEKPKEERVALEKKSADPDLERKILVIDEVAQMYLVGGSVKSSEIQEAQRILALLTAQGRAAGIHAIVATQKPDVRALDSQIKANLTGKVCFAMPNIASSMTVLGNGRAVELPSGKGRAFWQSGSELIEVQIPLVEAKDVETMFAKDTSPKRIPELEEKKSF